MNLSGGLVILVAQACPMELLDKKSLEDRL